MGSAMKVKCWSFSTGERGTNRVRVYEKEPGGLLLLEFYERQLGTGELQRKRVSLGHADRVQAKAKAEEIAGAIRKHEGTPGELTLAALFDIYLAEVTPQKGASAQNHDPRALELFLRSAGRSRKPSSLSRRDWDKFINARRSGALRPEGSNHNSETVRNSVIEQNLKLVVAVFNWAAMSKDEAGKLLLDRNPFKGFPYPSELNPIRRVFTQDQYNALWKASEGENWRFRRLILITYQTGHRIGAVRQLRRKDVDLELGIIRWSKEYDKLGRDHETPIPDELRPELEAWLKDDSSEWLVPAVEDLAQAMSRNTAQHWMNRMVRKIGLKSGDRYGWHSLRRQFATELYPNVAMPDLCALGGWRNSRTVEICYIKPDMESMRGALAKRKAG